MQSKLSEFLPCYEREHRNVANCYVHHIAHSVAGLGILLIGRPLLGIPLVAAGFVLSCAGHYALERNTRAFFDPAAQSGVTVGFIEKAQVALGGLVWSGACLLRLLHIGPLVQADGKSS